MGLFDTVLVDESLELPDYPESSHGDIRWQSKDIRAPTMDTYRITSDGRLEMKEMTFRDMTDEERMEYMDEHAPKDYDSWEEWSDDDDTLGPLPSWDQTVDEEWWADQNYHGSFEFHHVLREDPQGYNEIGGPTDYATKEYWSFEARFTKGDLDEIVKLDVHDVS